MNIWKDAEEARVEEAARTRKAADADARARKQQLERAKPAATAIDTYVQQFITTVTTHGAWPQVCTEKRLIRASVYTPTSIELSSSWTELHFGDRCYGDVYTTVRPNGIWRVKVRKAQVDILQIRKNSDGTIEAMDIPEDFSASSDYLIWEVVKSMVAYLHQNNLPLPD